MIYHNTLIARTAQTGCARFFRLSLKTTRLPLKPPRMARMISEAVNRYALD